MICNNDPIVKIKKRCNCNKQNETKNLYRLIIEGFLNEIEKTRRYKSNLKILFFNFKTEHECLFKKKKFLILEFPIVD